MVVILNSYRTIHGGVEGKANSTLRKQTILAQDGLGAPFKTPPSATLDVLKGVDVGGTP